MRILVDNIFVNFLLATEIIWLINHYTFSVQSYLRDLVIEQ